ncbi:MAG: flagella basal body P-ring formation protein FlgA [Pirellulaceae bacterium]|nr:flagella basal body P-ring formation protein FlgA [Pirellulaceae bacterium]
MRKIGTYFLLFLASGWSAEGAEIVLRGEATCAGPVVRLADVAELADAAAAELAQIPLFPAPAAGQSRVARLHEIRQLLQLSEVDIRGLQIRGASEVTIHYAPAGAERVIVRPNLQFVPSAANVQPAPIRQDRQVRPAVHAPQLPMPAAEAEPPAVKLVQRGKGVTIHALAPGVRISSSGKALADGVLGDEITVELADSRQQVQGRVTAPQTVEIRSGASR